jgi:Fic family protein
MVRGDYVYIWQAGDWPAWRFDLAALAQPLADVSRAQGLLMGRLADVGLALRDQASLSALTEDVIKTSAIEGEQLDAQSVRSSIARRLGVDIGALAPVDRHVEGVVEMVLDATANCHAPITRERLFGWHAALFPTGHSGLGRNQGRPLARRRQRPDAGRLRPAAAPARAFRSATGRTAGGGSPSLPGLGPPRLRRAAADQGRPRAPLAGHRAPVR